MKFYEIVDFIQRKINSLLFRFVLICYSILILNLSQNEFGTLIYSAGILLYFLFYIYLTHYDKLRMFNDFLLIGFILYGKNPNEIVNFIYLILPIVNSINFSGQKKSILLYIITIAEYLFLICIFTCTYNIEHICSNLTPLVSIISLWFINAYTFLRSKFRLFREELNASVENFYLKKEFLLRPHKIYVEIIEIINRNLKSELVNEIICFTIRKSDNDKMVIVNGSKFIWHFKFEKSDIVNRLREKKFLIDEPLKIEGKKNQYSLIIYLQVEEQEYIYAFINSTPLPLYYAIIGFFRVLPPTFSKISRVLLTERQLIEIKDEELKKLSERSQYVSRANKTMHYIRNRLGPFANLIKQLDNLEKVPLNKLDNFKLLLLKEKERAKIELENITQRANEMLEKSTNPYIYISTKPISLERVYTVLKRNFYTFFPDSEMKVDIVPDEIKKYVSLNEEGFVLILSDWLNNMQKYKVNLADCSFKRDDDTLLITFRNDHDKSVIDINQMISDLVSNDRTEIMRRTTHGLYTMKVTLEEMNIPFQLEQNEDEKILSLILKLKIFEDESSNI